jgi:predicted TIM-barrel enzyme
LAYTLDVHIVTIIRNDYAGVKWRHQEVPVQHDRGLETSHARIQAVVEHTATMRDTQLLDNLEDGTERAGDNNIIVAGAAAAREVPWAEAELVVARVHGEVLESHARPECVVGHGR